MIKQVNMFAKPQKESEEKYSLKIEAPIYKPKNKRPFILELYDKTKASRLINEIKGSGLNQEEKEFLIEAAKRHVVFNYEKIADYYSHASREMQELMENSALVIIDFDKAIQNGYVKLCESIKEQFLEEYPDDEK